MKRSQWLNHWIDSGGVVFNINWLLLPAKQSKAFLAVISTLINKTQKVQPLSAFNSDHSGFLLKQYEKWSYEAYSHFYYLNQPF